MFWKFKRRWSGVMWKNQLFYFSAVIVFFLFVNVFLFQRNFASLEAENNVDPGGTISKLNYDRAEVTKTRQVFQERNTRHNLRYMFENKLRKLLDIMESNLEHTATYGSNENEIPFEKYFSDRLLYCDDILNITDMTYMASGWTKAVYKGTFKGSPVAIKTVDVKGQEVTTCVEAGSSQTACYIKAAKKIVKEIVVLQAIAGENILKVLGFCLPRNADDNLWVAMVTELGEAVDLIKLLQMSWEDRLKVCLDITKIINYMSKTSYGSMSMNDFRRQQFVLINGTLKLSDVDDTGFEDPSCVVKADCDVTFSSANFSQRTRCIHNKCVDYNEKRNVYNAGRHFVTFLLPHGAPPNLQPIIEKVVDGYNDLTMTSQQLLKLMNDIVTSYKTGSYLNRTKSDHDHSKYSVLHESDLPGLYDYRCRLSLSIASCTISVYDEHEAEDVCNNEEQCEGFVMTKHITWSGRRLVHLKNGTGKPAYNADTTLYIRQR
ncbi:hypothetical protein ACF0H5_003041 [Mactra antiquata]